MTPYQNRGPIIRPEDFIGRERELANIYAAIGHGTCVSLVGERRTGKTSLLNLLKSDPDSAPDSIRYCCVNVDCQYHTTSTQTQLIRFILDRFEDEFDVAPLEPTLDSLRQAARSVLARAGFRLVILLDEIGALASNKDISSHFFGFLRAWSQDFRIVFITTSKENSSESLVWDDRVGSPFWNIFKTIYIGPFPEAEALTLIREPSQAQGIEFSAAEEQSIVHLAGHQPFLLQIACDHMFQGKSNRLASDRLLAEVTSQFRMEAIPHLDQLWKYLPDSEQDALAAVARGEALKPGRAQAELLRKGILLEDASGTRIFSSIFQERINDRLAQQPMEKLLARVRTIFR